MTNKKGNNNGLKRSNSHPEPVVYEIKVQGQLGQVWARWFEGMTITTIEDCEGGVACTSIAGPVVDQAALHGILSKIRDLNLTLISVSRYIQGKSTAEEVPIKPE